MSPSAASSPTKSGSLRSSPWWNRVFSRQSTSPGRMAFTAARAFSPMQSSPKATGRPSTSAIAGTSGLSESLRSGPFGRPKCDSRITLPPLAAMSRMVGAARAMRVTSATLPFSTGTLKSARRSTRLPSTSTPSSVRSDGIGLGLDHFSHRNRGIDHAIGETPFVIIPRHHAHQRAVHHLGLIDGKHRRMRIVVEVAGDIRSLRITEDALELLVGRAPHRGVDLVFRCRALGHELEIDDRNIGGRYADGDAVELAGKLGQHQSDRLRSACGGWN